MVDLVLFGAPGAGKGTQAELMNEWLPVPRVSSGDLFRYNLSNNTELGRAAKEYIDRGELVPDDVTIAMVAERLHREDCANGVILDGFPRTVAQAEALDRLLAEMGRKVDAVLFIRVSRESLLKRLAGRWTCPACGAVYHEVYHPERSKGFCDVDGARLFQREDDTPETQARRIDVYEEQTAPLEQYYRQKGILIEIDGEQDIAGVQAQIRKAVAELQ
ncbi:MAG: adenylate kinase [Anaerolineales bacterium]